MKPLPPNTVTRYAIHPADAGRIAYIEGLQDPQPLPHPGDRITRRFLVDPQTRQPVPVRVVEIREMLELTPPTLAVVVTREH